jgi:hypothetical protein
MSKQWAKRVAVATLLSSILIALIPCHWLVLPSMRLHDSFRPKQSQSEIRPYVGQMPTLFLGAVPRLSIGPLNYTLIISPQLTSSNGTTELFIQWYNQNQEWLANAMDSYGAILFRGFNVDSPINFDQIVGNIHPDIVSDIYLGTTPRHRVNGTRFIFTASEAPRFVTIPTHTELSFSPSPPKRIYFYADVVNPGAGGYTPLTDFRQVWRDLDKTLKEKMTTKGLIYDRWYRHEDNPPVDPLVHKTW